MAHVASWQYSYAKARGVVGRIAFTALMLLQLAAIHSSAVHAGEASVVDFPFLIDCEAGGVHQVFYLSKMGSDGVAVYMTPAGQAGTITLSGKVEQVGGNIENSCKGKTLEQLRSDGQAHYLQR